jgi:hypothetical protein
MENNNSPKLITWLDKSPYDIAVILPTRGRTDMLYRSIMSLIDNADDLTRIQILIGQDNDDVDTIEWTKENLYTKLDELGVSTTLIQFDRMGYHRLNEYINALAYHSVAEWIFFWNDDAVMETKGWDSRIAEHNGEFKVLRAPTHNEHPYAIFPIVPKDWFYLFGYLSMHPLNDAWISQIAYITNIMETIPVNVTHDRFDLTGNNKDETYTDRIILEGNPDSPADFNYKTFFSRRMIDSQKIAWFLQAKGHDTTWFKNVCTGAQDPWERMLTEFDPNGQVQKLGKPKL